jgi:hypothetical protein
VRSLSCEAPVHAKSRAESGGLKANQCLERTGCKSVTAHEKSREESALFVLGVAPVPAFQVGR